MLRVPGSTNHSSQNINHSDGILNVQPIGNSQKYRRLVEAILNFNREAEISNLIQTGPTLSESQNRVLRQWAKNSRKSLCRGAFKRKSARALTSRSGLFLNATSAYFYLYPRRLETLNWTRRDKVKSKRSGPNADGGIS